MDIILSGRPGFLFPRHSKPQRTSRNVFIDPLKLTFQLVKQCQAMVEAGRVYCQTSKSFANGLQELGHHCAGDAMMEVGDPHVVLVACWTL